MKLHFYIGVGIVILSEILLFSGVSMVATWFTPMVWWGYILITDGIIKKLKGKSLILDRTAEFFLMAVLSYFLWLIFEFYNLFLKNWYYINLPENPFVKHLGYFMSFTTIIPGLFFTAWLTKILIGEIGWKKFESSVWLRGTLIVLGVLCLSVPLIYPSKYIFAPVWIGFIFLLDPVNYILGNPSFLKDFEKGKYGMFLSFLIAGYICGFLWEFWNYWAAGRWVYTVPFTENIRIFEMPLAGFIGFGPFALEMFTMYYFSISLFGKEGSTPDTL